VSGRQVDTDAAVDAFNQSRRRLFGIAYRMLGSVAEAEDLVQEAWLRWQQTDRTVVRNPAGFLTTVATRLALNTAESARLRREPADPWSAGTASPAWSPGSPRTGGAAPPSPGSRPTGSRRR
jgi:DNA-directed RNA polymerase specialized sigma24 family protein